MPPPIGAASTGMNAIGSLLAGRQGVPAAEGAPGPTAAGLDAQQAQLTATNGKIRDLGEAVKQLAADTPTIVDEAQQIQQLLKQMVVKAAQIAPTQTASSMMIPGGGGGA